MSPSDAPASSSNMVMFFIAWSAWAAGSPGNGNLVVQGGAGLAAQVDDVAGPHRLAEPHTELLAVLVDLVGMKPLQAPVRRTPAPDDRQVDLEQDLGPSEPAHDEAGRAGAGVAEVPADGLVDGLAVGAVADVDPGLHHVVEPGPRFRPSSTRAFFIAWSAWAVASATVKPVPCMVRPSNSAPVWPRRKISSPVSISQQESRLISPCPNQSRGVHRPVLPVLAACGNHRLDIDFHLQFRECQPLDDQSGADRVVAAQVVGDCLVDRYPVGRVGQIGGDHGDVVETGARLLQQHSGVLHRLVGLDRRIGRIAKPLVEVESGLASKEDAVARPNRHAHVVVVTTAGVDVAGIELAEPLDPDCRALPIVAGRFDTRHPPFSVIGE